MDSHQFSGGKSVKSASFDQSTGVLTVEFASGDTRSHGGFTAEEWAEWLAQDAAGGNAGQWYHSRVRQRPKLHPEIPRAEAAPAQAPAPSAPPAPAPEAKAPEAKPAEVKPAPSPKPEAKPAEPPAPAVPAYKTALARARASRQGS